MIYVGVRRRCLKALSPGVRLSGCVPRRAGSFFRLVEYDSRDGDECASPSDSSRTSEVMLMGPDSNRVRTSVTVSSICNTF
eukprot:1469504-Prymnesium_polylepis.3